MTTTTTITQQQQQQQQRQNHIDVEKFFEDDTVQRFFLNHRVTKAFPETEGRGYGSNLIGLYSEQAVQVLMNHGEHRLIRSKPDLVKSVHKVADRIFFRMLSVYLIARNSYHGDDEKPNEDDNDNNDDDDDDDDNVKDDEDDQPDEEDNEEQQQQPRRIISDEFGETVRDLDRENRRLLATLDFGFAEMNVRRIGDGKLAKTVNEKSNVVCEASMHACLTLFQHFYHRYVHAHAHSANTVQETTTIRKMIRSSLTPQNIVELLMLLNEVYEILKRQSLVMEMYDKSPFDYAHCLEYERIVHSLYLTKLQLIQELRIEFNGNERNQDFLLASEILTIRERQATHYEKLLTYNYNLTRPPFTSNKLSAFLTMSDVRSHAIHGLLVDYLDGNYAGHPETADYELKIFLLTFLVKKCFRKVSSVIYPRSFDTHNATFRPSEQFLRDRRKSLNDFWQPLIRHCICLFPSSFVTMVFHYVAKRETSWKIHITDILRYMNWVCYDDPFYAVYTQRLVFRYLTFEESTLASHFNVLYDTECLLFGLLVPNRYDHYERTDQLRNLLGTRINETTDIPKRPFPATDTDDYEPFTYETFACKFLPGLNLSYYELIHMFYDTTVYKDTIRYGISLIVELLIAYKHSLSDTNLQQDNQFDPDDGVMMANDVGQQSDSSNKKSQADPRLVVALQTFMNFMNANCWFYDNQFIHLGHGRSHTAHTRKQFVDKMRVYSNELKPIDPALTFEKHVNFDDMIACCHRYVLTGSEKSDKMSKVLGNTRAASNSSTVNFAFLRYYFRGEQIVMSNIHINMYELVLPNLMYLISLDTANFEVEDSELFPVNVDQRVTEFTTLAIQHLPEYMRHLVSVDSLSMMLHAPLIREKKHETLITSFNSSSKLSSVASKNPRGNTAAAELTGNRSPASHQQTNKKNNDDNTGDSGCGGGVRNNVEPLLPLAQRKRKAEMTILNTTHALMMTSSESFVAAPSPPPPPLRRRHQTGGWQSLISQTLCRKKPSHVNKSETINGNSGNTVNPLNNTTATTQSKPAAGTPTPSTYNSSLSLPVQRDDQFVPYTLDREEFLQLSNNMNLQWAHTAYYTKKSFRYYVAAMMQILNQHGERIFLRENGLSLSINVMLQRLNPDDSARMKRCRNRFVDKNTDVLLSDDDDDNEEEADEHDHDNDKNENGGGYGNRDSEKNGGDTDGGSGGGGRSYRRSLNAAPRNTTTSLNLSLLLNTNTSATSISQFLSSMMKKSLENDEMNERCRSYFKRTAAAAASSTRTTQTAPPTPSTAAAAAAAAPQRKWSMSLDDDGAHARSTRSMHEELMLMENLKELLFDLFHDPTFFKWAVNTVDTNNLRTNNLLVFSDKCFLTLFTGYVYALRCIENKTRKSRSGGGGGVTTASIIDNNAADSKSNSTTPTPPRTLSEYFWRNGRTELQSLRKLFPSCQVSSPNLKNLATGLRIYLDSRFRLNQLPKIRGSLMYTKCDDICYFLITLYIFCDCNLAFMLFIMRFVVSIRFPGTWNKSINILQGSSNSGKSELIEQLRSFYNSAGGLIDASEWRGLNNDIGTNLFPLMENLLCQSDEVVHINSMLMKNLISKTAKRCRSFGSQNMQQMHTLAKVVMTVNRKPFIETPDEGMLQRMEVVVPVFHQYQPLVQRETNTSKIQNTAAYNVSYQIIKQRYPIGMHESTFRSGMFYFVNHYGPYLTKRDETVFLAADLHHQSQLALFLRGEDRTRLSVNTLSLVNSCDSYRVEAIFHANTTTLADMSSHTLQEIARQKTPDYYLQNTLARVSDSNDTKTYVNLQNQPLIVSFSKKDFHASIDPMAKFHMLYSVKQSNIPIHWSRIERLLRNHLHEYYLNEERGDSGISINGSNDVDMITADLDNPSSVAIAPPRIHKKIDYRAFYDRFKMCYANFQHRDLQTNHRTNEWCLTIQRIG